MSRFLKTSALFFFSLLSLRCSNNSAGPGSGVSLTGTFIGDYTASANPGVVYQGVLQATQTGSNLTGALTTNAGRSALVSASVSGLRLSGTLTFTDACGGSASTTADIADSGRRLAGNYSASDCNGQYTGGYLFVKTTAHLALASGNNGNNQTGTVNQALPRPLVAAVLDQFNNPINGVIVNWAVTAGGGTLSDSSVATNAQGLSAVTWTLGPNIGAQSAGASVLGLPGSPVTYAATALNNNFALDFSNSWAAVPHNSALSVQKHWTIEAWVYPRNASGGRQHLVSKWNGSPNASYAFVIEAGHLSLEVNDGVNPTDFVNSSATLANNVWQHVAVSFDSGTARLYINGALDTTVTGLVIPTISDRPLSFGHEGPPYNGWLYDGLLDEIRLWNVTRTGAEINANKSVALVGSAAGLVGYWRFNEGSGDVTSDATGHGLNAQLGSTVGVDVNDPRWSANAAPVP